MTEQPILSGHVVVLHCLCRILGFESLADHRHAPPPPLRLRH